MFILCVWIHVLMGTASTHAHSGQKMATYPLQLELQVVVLYPAGAGNQGQEARPVREVSAFNHVAISPPSPSRFLSKLTSCSFSASRQQVHCVHLAYASGSSDRKSSPAKTPINSFFLKLLPDGCSVGDVRTGTQLPVGQLLPPQSVCSSLNPL